MACFPPRGVFDPERRFISVISDTFEWRTIVRRDTVRPRLGERTVPDEPILRDKAREAIRTGKLPSRQPDRMWGGPGIGKFCTICGEPINWDQLELEIQFARVGSSLGHDSYPVHVRCFAAWEFERITV